MAILRKQQREQYTMIDNQIFRNTELSYKAKGLLCQMLSLPDGWEYSIEGLTMLSTDGKSSVTSALDELKKAGYFFRKQVRNGNRIAGVEYVISEYPMSDFLFTENQHAENQHAEKQHAENQQQYITNISNTNISNTNSSKEEIYIDQSNTPTEEVLPEKPRVIKKEFEELWKLYPKKQGKDKAYGYYERARRNGTTYEEVVQGIEAYKEYIRANEVGIQFVKQGATFFSQKAWNDDWSIRTNNYGTYSDFGTGNKKRADTSQGVPATKKKIFKFKEA